MTDKKKPTQADVLISANLKLLKSTPGTHVYGNEDEGIKTLYLPKLLFSGSHRSDPPKELTLQLSIPEVGK